MATTPNPYAGKTVADLEAITRQGGLAGDAAIQLAEALHDAKNHAEDLKNSVEDLSGKLQKMLNITGKNAAIFNQMAVNFNPLTGQANKLYTTMSNLSNVSTIWMQLVSMAVDRFKELDDAALSFRLSTGFLASQTSQVETNVRTASRDLARFGVTVESANEAAQELANRFGDTAIASKENIEYVSLMKENLGISAENSVDLMQNFMGLGGMTSQVAKETAGAAASLAKAAGVPFNKVMQEVAKPSAEVRSLVRGSVDALIKGAIEAKRLGTSLEAVGKAAAGMLDFQTSINDEMEASVLFGKDVNLQKARELAYAGDIKGLAKEQSRLLQQAGDVSKMDYFQRMGIAKALGMSVEEMDKMNAKQKEMNELKIKSPELYKQLTAELDTLDKTNESVTEKYQKELKSQQLANVQKKLMNDIQQVMVEISEALLPVVKLFFNILVPILKVGAAIVSFILTPIRWMNDGIDYFLNKFGGASKILSPVYEGFQKLYDVVSGFFKTTDEGFIALKTGLGTLGTVFLIYTFPKIIAAMKSIISFAKNKFFPGAGGSGLPGAAPGAAPTVPGGAPAVPGAGGVPAISGAGGGAAPNPTAGQKIKEFLTNLAEGIKAFKPISEILKGLIGIAASGPAFLLFIPAIPGLLLMAGIGALGVLITAGFTALSTGIKMMDISLIGKGLLGIAALGLSIIPFAFAMTLFSDVNWTGVIAGAAALVIFAAAAFGLGALLAGPGAILFGAGVIGIAALGVAMLPLATAAKLAGEGMKDFGAGVKDIAANISQIASLEETLSIFKDQELINGIYSMGFAIAFLNSQLSALGTNLPALAEINKSKNEQSANGEVVAKLDELIGLMQSGAIAVNIDGSKVSTAVGVATKFRGAS
jgi:hypothetical protein